MSTLKILAGGSLRQVLGHVARDYERQSGDELDILWAGTPQLIATITAGQPFDAGVFPAEVLEDATAAAVFSRQQPSLIASSVFGVAVRAGCTPPDLSSPQALASALRQATSIAVFPASAAGAYVDSVIRKLGLETDLMPKLKVAKGPEDLSASVACGTAELGLFLTHTLTGDGLAPAVPFPQELQRPLKFVGIAHPQATAPSTERFLAYLRSGPAKTVMQAYGLVTP
jgi:molybdate transport system substrate-binding protein